MWFPEVVLRLPDWVEQVLPGPEQVCKSVEERMRLAIKLAKANIEHGTGGPFGAVIFEQESGKLLAAGVNMVTGSNCSAAHAEMTAFAIAQKIIGNYDLGADSKVSYELVTSVEPCAMCLGAIPWSGVRRVVCGARDEDAREIGFDEGPKISNWVQALEQRGIQVVRDVLRDEAKAVLREYLEAGGFIYNARRGNTP